MAYENVSCNVTSRKCIFFLAGMCFMLLAWSMLTFLWVKYKIPVYFIKLQNTDTNNKNLYLNLTAESSKRSKERFRDLHGQFEHEPDYRYHFGLQRRKMLVTGKNNFEKSNSFKTNFGDKDTLDVYSVTLDKVTEIIKNKPEKIKSPVFAKAAESLLEDFSVAFSEDKEKKNAVVMENKHCAGAHFKNKLIHYKSERKNCWQHFYNSNQNKRKIITPAYSLCAFEPLRSNNYNRVGKKTVIVSIGVHLGPAASGKYSAHCGNIEFISWELRDKNFFELKNLLIHGFTKSHLLKTQKSFWEKYRNDQDLQRADVIACGFDTWHCLIFAPFNKKLILNSAYRFDGHVGIEEEDQVDLQQMFYRAVRYNPDVIMAGDNIYDVMYHQHFLGSHKMIPLPATCGYVRQRMRSEISKGLCPDVPESTTGYHPTTPLQIAISPYRLSKGGAIVAKQIMKYFQSRRTRYKIVILNNHLKKPYKYCDLGKYAAFIVLGYSVMSYFHCECASLGIPMFVPSPRLYAEFERKYHLIRERKGTLDHTSFDYMKQNPRSLNYGYNPNDDFNMTSLTRWVGYSDYFYYKGVVKFDGYDDLFRKIQISNFKKMNEDFMRHDAINAFRTQEHWKSIDRYFHGNENDDVIAVMSSVLPKTLDEGYENWKEKIERPNFDKDKTLLGNNHSSNSETCVILNLHEYLSDFKVLSKYNCSQGYRLIFYGKDVKSKVDIFSQGMNCIFYDINELEYPKHWKNPLSYIQFAVLFNVTRSNPSKVVILEKTESGCKVSRNYSGIVNFSTKWSQRSFYPQQYFLAWLPIDNTISGYYLSALKRFTNKQLPDKCSLFSSKTKKYTQDEFLYLQDYLKYWVTDESLNFFHIVDQLNFELAVKGYMTRSNAIMHRFWMEHLARCNIITVPTLIDKSEILRV